MILTPEFLHREHEKGRKALREIAEDLRLPRRIVHERAKDLGIKIQPGGVRPHQFDDEWLRDQYVVRLRSGSDISRETGTSGMPVLRRLTALGIPIRPAGAYSRRDMLAKLDESVPLDIRAAVEGTLHGWRRLNRFQIHMVFPNATATAAYLNVKPNTLSMQFGQLERAIGAELFHRSTGHTPQRPTTRGAALLHHLADERIRLLMREALGRSIMTMPKLKVIAAAQTAFGGKPAR